MDALLTAYERSELFDSAIAAVRERAHQRRSDHEREMNAVDTEMRQAEEAITRYLRAFEVGALSQEVCGERTAELKRQIEELRARHADLESAIAQGTQDAPSAYALEAMQAHLRDALLNDPLPARKALMKALVHEVVIDGRTATPFFVLPGQPTNGEGSGVRFDRKLVHPRCQNPNPMRLWLVRSSAFRSAARFESSLPGQTGHNANRGAPLVAAPRIRLKGAVRT
jgi:hypothetical protein